MVSGKFVFTIWFKAVPGTGRTQPTTVTTVEIKNGVATSTTTPSS